MTSNTWISSNEALRQAKAQDATVGADKPEKQPRARFLEHLGI